MKHLLILFCLFPLLCGARPTVEQQERYREAEALYQEGDYPASLSVWEQLLDGELDAAEQRVVRFNMARTLMQMEHWDAAIPILEAVTADQDAKPELLRVVYSHIATAALEQADKLCPSDIDLENPEFPDDCLQALTWLEHARSVTDQAFIHHRQAALMAGRDIEREPDDLRRQRRAERLRSAWIQQKQREHWRRHAPYEELVEAVADDLEKSGAAVREGATLDAVAIQGRNRAGDWMSVRERAPAEDLAQDLLFESLNSYQRALEYIDAQSRDGTASQMARGAYALHGLAELQRGNDVFGYLLATRERLIKTGADAKVIHELFAWLQSVRPDEDPLRQATLAWIAGELNATHDASMHRRLLEILAEEETQSLLRLLEREDAELLNALAQKFALRAELENSERARAARKHLLDSGAKQALLFWDPAAYVLYELSSLQKEQEALLRTPKLDGNKLDTQSRGVTELRDLVRNIDGIAESSALLEQLNLAEERNRQAAQFLGIRRPQHAKAYVMDAKQWLRRGEQVLTKAEDRSPADHLRWGVEEQAHARDLNDMIQNVKEAEPLHPTITEALGRAQDLTIESVTGFLPAVQEQVPDQSQDPWTQVLPLFEQGNAAAQQANNELAMDDPPLAAAQEFQIEAHDRWKEALDLIEPPDEQQNPDDQGQSPESDDNQQDQTPPESPDQEPEPPPEQESPDSPQEILEMLQRMEDEDRHTDPGQGRVREGLKPW